MSNKIYKTLSTYLKMDGYNFSNFIILKTQEDLNT